ncbi:hypothetical protein PFLCHA0_c10950 [Pseudomonas protegens CHA0]|uniref:Uncharacterized protein n=1 Tax=Pseudomonas protegens (strain DSM 19095 / LMG 27888 / CFBP 6595 / CHA0) TaxID=1124983 RepID=A0A2C9EGW1_PSEPH|nr:hypothetical protein PFLCHA0_c10950 [Pseudomonas protegens CHA0]
MCFEAVHSNVNRWHRHSKRNPRAPPDVGPGPAPYNKASSGSLPVVILNVTFSAQAPFLRPSARLDHR